MRGIASKVFVRRVRVSVGLAVATCPCVALGGMAEVASINSRFSPRQEVDGAPTASVSAY